MIDDGSKTIHSIPVWAAKKNRDMVCHGLDPELDSVQDLVAHTTTSDGQCAWEGYV